LYSKVNLTKEATLPLSDYNAGSNFCCFSPFVALVLDNFRKKLSISEAMLDIIKINNYIIFVFEKISSDF
jgi:hypothetical protein